MVPAVCLQPSNESNNNEPFSIPAFQLFSKDRLSMNAPLPENNDIHDTFANNFDSLDPWSTEVYYAIEDYLDEMGDGVNLKRGKKVNVNANNDSKKFIF